MKVNRYLYGLVVLVSLLACQNNPKDWKYDSTIDLGNTTPIGLTVIDNHIWVADGDNNQLLHLDESGRIRFTEEGFDRPMHIGSDGQSIYVPEYGKDQITIFKGNDRMSLPLTDSLDAPAGIHFADGKFAIADFYNHRILFGNEDKWISFGKEGKGDGEFYYPTDVHIAHQKIYVADAYNNRIQVFGLDGSYLQSIGKEDNMNASTGIFVGNETYVTDFENNRVLIYSLDGKLVQIIDKDLDKPTDVFVKDDVLYIANYKGKNLMTYKRS